MALPRFTKTLHFRLSLLFLGLLALLAVVYILWVEATVLKVHEAPGAEEWYERIARTEIDSLAALVAPLMPSTEPCDSILAGYAPRVDYFDAELTLVGADGMVLSSTRPDSLSQILRQVAPSLLDAMAAPGWDFDSYPNPYDIDAYENRIFAVARIVPPTPAVREDGATPALGYLVGSFRPLNIVEGQVERWHRFLALQAGVVIVVFAAIAFLVTMAYVSRRLRALSRGMAEFREGDLQRRFGARAADELGQLERDFNSMADRLSDLIGRLRQSEEFHRQLVANISHDLRTPLASLRGYIEILDLPEHDLPAARQERALRAINANLSLLERLVDSMLDLSRLDAGQAGIRSEAFPLAELCYEVLARCEAIAAERGVRLDCRAAQPLPDVLADPLRIGRVLQNLVENGIKFNRQGGEVVISATAAAQAIEIAVSDSGCGIPPDDLPRIFERFFTGDPSRSGREHGVGLGLAIAQRIIEAHGEKLEVTSRVGEGAIFRFRLPRADAQPGTAAPGGQAA